MAEKKGDMTLRSDAEPLVMRFPVLGTPSKVRWMSGTLGGGAAPGPTSYWIDAVIWVTPEVATTLRQAQPTATASLPDLVAGLGGQVPSGSYLAGESLNSLFRSSGWWPEALLHSTDDVVVLSAKGQ